MKVAYVILGSPFRCGNDRCLGLRDGPVPPERMLWLHVWSLTVLCHSLARVFIMLPTDARRGEIAGYASLGNLPRLLPCEIEEVRVSNNSLGSYGMYLHAFAISRGAGFSYYVFSEVDYLPVMPHFDATLVAMHAGAFPQSVGALVGIVQGQPVEPDSTYDAHPEGSHIMSTATIERIFAHVYEERRWKGSTAAYILNRTWSVYGREKPSRRLLRRNTYYNVLQQGFGLLLKEAGIEQRDWTGQFRSPYWHAATGSLVDWTGASASRQQLPMRRLLFAPTQMLFLDTVTRCCGQNFQACWDQHPRCTVRRWHSDGDCCSGESIPWTLVALKPQTPPPPEVSTCPAISSGVLMYPPRSVKVATDWLRSTTAPAKPRAASSCGDLVSPVDTSPIRSPQVLHTAILPHVRGKRVVEIGTRRGDSVACYAQVAASATAVEVDPGACLYLKRRSASLRANGSDTFEVVCEDYRANKALLDADVYTWWQEPPLLDNLEVLWTLRFTARPALALLAFDPQYHPDMADLHILQGANMTDWVQSVGYDEYTACIVSDDKDLSRDRRLCSRARGVFHLAAVAVKRIDLALLELAWGARGRQKSRPG